MPTLSPESAARAQFADSDVVWAPRCVYGRFGARVGGPAETADHPEATMGIELMYRTLQTRASRVMPAQTVHTYAQARPEG